MSYCKYCGNEVEDGAQFCENCGQSLERATRAPQRRYAVNKKQLHCPECGSVTLTPIVETEISGGTSVNHSFTRKTSASQMQFNNTHRNYWMCSNCGHKFRNLQNLEQEITSLQKKVKNGWIGTFIVALLALVCAIGYGIGFTLLFFVPILAIIIVALFILKGRINKMEEEREYLKANCFG